MKDLACPWNNYLGLKNVIRSRKDRDLASKVLKHHAHACTHAFTCACAHTCTCTHMCICTYVCTTHTHTRMHANGTEKENTSGNLPSERHLNFSLSVRLITGRSLRKFVLWGKPNSFSSFFHILSSAGPYLECLEEFWIISLDQLEYPNLSLYVLKAFNQDRRMLIYLDSKIY